MNSEIKKSDSETADMKQYLPAGDFSSWLRHARSALLDERGTDVTCGACVGCCSSSYFIQIKPDETRPLGRIHKKILVPAPGLPEGHMQMGYNRNGLCPLLKGDKCSIYEHRPRACRNYDCRVFAAAGITAGGDDKAAINERVRCWKFSYLTEQDRNEHLAVQAAARFIREHARFFPGGRVPSEPSQLAIIAIKAYDVFLKKAGATDESEQASSGAEIATAIVDACRKFDAKSSVNPCKPRKTTA